MRQAVTSGKFELAKYACMLHKFHGLHPSAVQRTLTKAGTNLLTPERLT